MEGWEQKKELNGGRVEWRDGSKRKRVKELNGGMGAKERELKS